MKTVHVIFKTHLDIGFTDYGQCVIDNYINNFIPKAIEIAFEVNKDETKPLFIWTLGSYLIDLYLKVQTEDKVKRMEKAIEKGFIKWHGLPLTFHTELAHKRTMEYSLNIAKKLDKKYNKKTIACKMTDVPGHTISLVPLLNKAGIKFLHIGVNAASSVPNVPDVFVWKHYDGSDIIVCYNGDYGTVTSIDGFDHILYFAHTHDNTGPQTKEQIIKQMKEIQDKYPDYIVKASTLDEYAGELLKIKDKLPVVEEEIGDSWIHGGASDPFKMGAYRELMRLQEKWIKENKLEINSNIYEQFNDYLMLIPEHTWGMDIKRHLFDFKNYEKEAFQKARKIDKVTDESIPPFYIATKNITEPELRHTTKKWEDRSYSTFEKSWAEKREYLNKAISVLPDELKIEAEKALINLSPSLVNINDFINILPNKRYQLGSYTVSFDTNGAISYLMDSNGKIWANKEHKIAEFTYMLHGVEEYDFWWKHYSRNLDLNAIWCYADFGKAGMELLKNIPRSQAFKPQAIDYRLIKENELDTVIIDLTIDEEASLRYGAPRKYQIKYTFTEDINVEFSWFEKDANRLPESLWLSFNLNIDNPNRYLFNKLGSNISPLNVVRNGSRNIHAIDHDIIYKSADGEVKIKSYDALLVSPGKPKILRFDNEVSLNGGLHFNLLNNIWGTNFVMWYEEDAKFRFVLSLKSNK